METFNYAMKKVVKLNAADCFVDLLNSEFFNILIEKVNNKTISSIGGYEMGSQAEYYGEVGIILLITWLIGVTGQIQATKAKKYAHKQKRYGEVGLFF